MSECMHEWQFADKTQDANQAIYVCSKCDMALVKWCGTADPRELERENAELRQRVEAMRGYLLHIKVLASTILTSEEQLEEKQ